MANLATFSGDDLAQFGDVIRAVPREARTMEDAARRVVDILYDGFLDEDGAHACALLRLYKTHPYGALEPDLQEFARSTLDGEPDADVRCLTLLATRGELPEWNDRRGSVGHRAIPLPSAEFVQRLPMVAALVRELGLEVDDVVRPQRGKLVELAQRTYHVFHVERAVGSPFLPAQDFVERHRIAAALGFGGMLFTGDFFAVVLFSRVRISPEVADTVRVLSLAARVALLPFTTRVFA